MSANYSDSITTDLIYEGLRNGPLRNCKACKICPQLYNQYKPLFFPQTSVRHPVTDNLVPNMYANKRWLWQELDIIKGQKLIQAERMAVVDAQCESATVFPTARYRGEGRIIIYIYIFLKTGVRRSWAGLIAQLYSCGLE